MSEEKKKNLFERAIDALTDRDEKEAAASKAAAEAVAAERAAEQEKTAARKAAGEKASAERATVPQATANRIAGERVTADFPKKGIVAVRSLRIRAQHNTASEVVGGLVKGDEVTILSTWSDGTDTWAQLDKGWAAMIYDGEPYIHLS